MVIVAVVFGNESFSWSLPVAADREFLGVIGRPNLDLINVSVAQTSSLHLVGKCLAIAVVTFSAEEEVFLAANQDFKI